MRRAGLARSALWVLVTLYAWRAAASDDNLFRLEYQAPAECPSAEEFLQRLLAKTARVAPAVGPVLARTVHVTIDLRDQQAHASLVFFDRNAARVQRDVSAPDCRAVADALVLITALALDSQLAPSVAEHELDLELPCFLSPWAAASGRPAGLEPAEVQGPGPAFGLWARVHTAAMPELGRGLAVFAELVGPGRIGFGAAWVTAGTVDRERRQARFDGVWGELSWCPWKLTRGHMSLFPCMRAEVGLLRGIGHRNEEIVEIHTTDRLWVALDFTVRLQTELWGLLALEFEGGPSLPFTRPRFRFLVPEVEVFQPPLVGLVAGMGLSYRLP